MQHHMDARSAGFAHPRVERAAVTGSAGQAYKLLYLTFIALPLIAGLDKFFYRLTDWDRYLAPQVGGLFSLEPHTFLMGVGLVEVIAAIVVAARPQIGGYLLAVWLWFVSLNLLLIPGRWDIAARDIALSMAALALAKLAEARTAQPQAADSGRTPGTAPPGESPDDKLPGTFS